MQKYLLIVLTCLFSFFSCNALADDTQEKIYLVQILNQLNAMQPLILAAQHAQPENTRIQFHYTQYRDSEGRLHNGLLEDVQAIKVGITEKLNQASIEPRVVKPIQGDYIEINKGVNQP